jgi:hypothetical protein
MSATNPIIKPTKTQWPHAERPLPGRDTEMASPARHAVLGTPLRPPYPAGSQIAEFGMGCFWGAERLFWRISGVLSTAVGYAGGSRPNPTYAEVCSGRTGHLETVRVVFDPTRVSYARLLKAFWEEHDPTAGMRQGASPTGPSRRPQRSSHASSTSNAWRSPGMARSPPGSRRRAPSTSPRPITSSIWSATPTAIAAWRVPAYLVVCLRSPTKVTAHL